MGTKYTVDNSGNVTFIGDLTVDTDSLKIDSTNNRAGLGTASPTNRLHVLDATAGVAISRLEGTGTAGTYLQLTESGIESFYLGMDDGSNVFKIRQGLITGTVRFSVDGATGNIGVNTSAPAASALLDLTSSTKGFLAPRLTTTERDAISSPAAGLLIYNSTTTAYNYYNGTTWAAVGTGGGGSFTELRQTFTATGGQTLFTLSTAYTLGNLNLKVYRNGQLQNPGAGNDYTETTTTTFTMLNPQFAGDLISAVYVVPSVALLTPTVGTENRQSFTSTGSPQTFTLSSAYLNNGTNLKVHVNGILQRPSTNYSEDNTTQFSFATGLTSGDNVTATWTTAAVGVISYTPATEIRQDFVTTGAESGLYTLTGGATFTQGGTNLKVYVAGVLMRLGAGNDYLEPSNSSVQFTAGNYPLSGEVVSLVATTQTGALGSFQNRRDEFVSTSGQTTFSSSFTFVMGGSDMLVYNDGVLMKLGEDYYELNNNQIVFYTGRTLNSKVTMVAKLQAAAGDANSVNGISASITPTAGKLFPLDGSGQIPASANVYAILAAM